MKGRLPFGVDNVKSYSKDQIRSLASLEEAQDHYLDKAISRYIDKYGGDHADLEGVVKCERRGNTQIIKGVKQDVFNNLWMIEGEEILLFSFYFDPIKPVHKAVWLI